MTRFNLDPEFKKTIDRGHVISQLEATMYICFIHASLIFIICLYAIFNSITYSDYPNKINEYVTIKITTDDDNVIRSFGPIAMAFVLMFWISYDIIYWNHKLKSFDITDYQLFVIDKTLNKYNNELMHKRALIYHVSGFLDD